MSQKQKSADLISWLEQQWNEAVKDSEHPDKELLEKYSFYDGLTTAYEFVIEHVKQSGVQLTTDSRTAALMEIIDYADKKKKELQYNRIIHNLTSPNEQDEERGDSDAYRGIIRVCEKLLEEESC